MEAAQYYPQFVVISFYLHPAYLLLEYSLHNVSVKLIYIVQGVICDVDRINIPNISVLYGKSTS
jgi:hypothetical protein